MKVMDTVCGRTIALGDAYATVEHNGALYCFCSRSCWMSFLQDPHCYEDLKAG